MYHHKCTANMHFTCATGLHLVNTHVSNKKTCCVIYCADIDECERGRDDCHEYATCNNTIGSYYCTCNEGLTGDGINCIGENMAMYTVHFGFVIVCVSVHVYLSLILGIQALYIITISGILMPTASYVHACKFATKCFCKLVES